MRTEHHFPKKGSASGSVWKCGSKVIQPIRTLETHPRLGPRKKPGAVRFGQCEPLPERSTLHRTLSVWNGIAT